MSVGELLVVGKILAVIAGVILFFLSVRFLIIVPSYLRDISRSLYQMNKDCFYDDNNIVE